MTRAREVVVVGAGIAGTAAALAACRYGAAVTLLRGGSGASTLSSGAIDDEPWESLTAEPALLADDARTVLGTLDAFVVRDDRAVIATTAGTLRPARGLDRALLDLTRAEGRTVLVPRCEHRSWDADALVRCWNASPLREAAKLTFVVRDVSVLRHEDEHQLPDAELASRHDDPARVTWLCGRLREMCAGIDKPAVLLPPWLGVEREVASQIRSALEVPCGEAMGGVGGPSGMRFERARDRALAALHIHVLDGRATRLTCRREEDRSWRVESAATDGLLVQSDAVVLATGGVLGGGIEYTPGGATFGTALPTLPEPMVRLTCDAPGTLGARGRALQDPSSLFGAAPEVHAWPHVAMPLLDCIGLLVDSDGRVVGAPPGLYAAGEVAADQVHTWLRALISGARAGVAAAG